MWGWSLHSSVESYAGRWQRAERPCTLPCPTPGVVGIVAEDGHVAEFATRSSLFAVEVHVCPFDAQRPGEHPARLSEAALAYRPCRVDLADELVEQSTFDFPELKDSWPFLWYENEYVVDAATTFILAANAVQALTHPAP